MSSSERDESIQVYPVVPSRSTHGTKTIGGLFICDDVNRSIRQERGKWKQVSYHASSRVERNGCLATIYLGNAIASEVADACGDSFRHRERRAKLANVKLVATSRVAGVELAVSMDPVRCNPTSKDSDDPHVSAISHRDVVNLKMRKPWLHAVLQDLFESQCLLIDVVDLYSWQMGRYTVSCFDADEQVASGCIGEGGNCSHERYRVAISTTRNLAFVLDCLPLAHLVVDQGLKGCHIDFHDWSGHHQEALFSFRANDAHFGCRMSSCSLRLQTSAQIERYPLRGSGPAACGHRHGAVGHRSRPRVSACAHFMLVTVRGGLVDQVRG